jgi:hypothetical protein
VAAATLIFTGVVTGEFTVPPLDVSTPDADYHILHLTFDVDEYLKGTGPASYTYNTGTALVFDEMGNVIEQANTCGPWGHPQAGTRFLVLADEDGIPPPIFGAARLDTEYGQSLLQQVLGVLNATPTPLPTTSPSPTAAFTRTPAALPDSGGSSSDEGLGFSDQVPDPMSEARSPVAGLAGAIVVAIVVAIAVILVILSFRKRP